MIDGFLFGNYEVLHDMFDYLYIIGKKYKLLSQMTNNYINYINDVAELCLSFIDEKTGDKNIKNLFPINNEGVQFRCYHALFIIYMYGLSTKVKKNLIKAQEMLIKVNSYYYLFGKLYEKGIGTEKNEKKALSFYQKGCKSLHNLYDSFIIVYYRYLSLQKIKSDKYSYLISNSNNLNKKNVIVCLSAGNIDIKLSLYDNMTVNDMKIELYKKKELQNLQIRYFLYNANILGENEIIGNFNFKKNEKIIAVCDIERAMTPSS